MQGRIEFKKLQRDMKPRDAVISFQCFSPDFVRVSEMADDGKIHHQEVQRHSKVVAGNRRAIHLLCKTGRLREETGQARSFLRSRSRKRSKPHKNSAARCGWSRRKSMPADAARAAG